MEPSPERFQTLTASSVTSRLTAASRLPLLPMTDAMAVP